MNPATNLESMGLTLGLTPDGKLTLEGLKCLPVEQRDHALAAAREHRVSILEELRRRLLPTFCRPDCQRLLIEPDGAWCIHHLAGEFPTGFRALALMSGCLGKKTKDKPFLEKSTRKAPEWVAVACACRFNNCTMLGDRKPLECQWRGEVVQ